MSELEDAITERDQFEVELNESKKEINYLTDQLNEANDKIYDMQRAFDDIDTIARKWS